MPYIRFTLIYKEKYINSNVIDLSLRFELSRSLEFTNLFIIHIAICIYLSHFTIYHKRNRCFLSHEIYLLRYADNVYRVTYIKAAITIQNKSVSTFGSLTRMRT